MKTKSINRTCLGITLVCCVLVFTMCKKKDSQISPGIQGQRLIVATIYLQDSVAWKTVYNYSGALCAEAIQNIAPAIGGTKIVFQYSGNTIISCTNFSKPNEIWNKVSHKEINGYVGDNPAEIITHEYDDDGIERYQYKTIYTYNGSLLIKMEEFHFYYGVWEQVGTSTYTYDSKGRIQQEADTSNHYGHVINYYYDGDHMTESVRQGYNDGQLTNSGKTTYTYTNNRLSVSVNYFWDSATWIQDGQMQYEYNEAGNISRETYTGSGGYSTMRVDFTYGAGSGNYRQCAKVAGGILILPGDPEPMPVKSKRYQFSSGLHAE